MNTEAKQFRIGMVAVVIISLHVLLSLYFLFAPAPRNRILSIYKQLALVGPFFTESRIKTTHYLAVRFKKDNAWSSFRRPAKEYFLEYHDFPWRWDRLAYIVFEIHSVSALKSLGAEKSGEEVRKSGDFRELHGVLMEMFVKEPADSIQIVSGLEHYDPKTGVVSPDTAFAFTYAPTSIGNVRK